MRDKALQSLRDAIPASDSLKAQAAHYIGIFEALPIPALLLDASGTVIDVNEAFVEFGHQTKSLDSDSERIGLSILECVDAPGGMTDLQALIDGMLKRGEVGEIEGEIVDGAGRKATVVVRGTPLEDGDERVIGGVLLREDITERRRLEKRRHTILEVRDEVWTMRTSEDIERVLGAVRDALRQLAVPFEDCGVNLVDANSTEASVWFHSMRTDGRWGQVGPDVPGADVITAIWQAGKTAYRRDLDAEDRYAESAQIDRDLGHHVRSVVDVPFSHGTLAVNNSDPEAFSQTDIDILEELGQILSEGFLRLDDFRQLEERNRDLEIGILEREQAESALRESEEKLRSVVENAPDYIMTLDLDGRILYSNRMPQALDDGQLAGASIFDAAKPEYGDALRGQLEQAVTTGENATFAIEGHARDGETVWFDCRIAPVYRDGDIAELTMVLQDITARKEAEAVLHRSREELEHLVERRTADLERAASERERRALQLRALQRVREEMWKMQYTNEIETVLAAVRAGLDDLDLSFAECGINMVVDSADPPIVRTFTTGEGQWLAEHQDPAHPVIEMWRKGEVAYRTDLHRDDALDERAAIEGNYRHPIRSVIDLPFSHGTLAVNSSEADAFTESDIAFMGEMAAVLSEVFKRIDDMRLMEQHTMMLESEVEERQRAEEELKRSLADKEVLLQEIHHRVKNNMQIVSSLIDLQSRQTTDEQSLELFRDSRDRIRSMALVHELLYQSTDLARIDLPGYIRTLTTDLFFSYTVGERVEQQIEVDDIALGIDMAIPCGLIINELVSNALKYAFPGESQGTVHVKLTRGEGDTYALQVADDGIGLPEDFDIRRTSSLGLTLVQTLVRQLRGELAMDGKGGTSFDITFSELPSTTLL